MQTALYFQRMYNLYLHVRILNANISLFLVVVR